MNTIAPSRTFDLPQKPPSGRDLVAVAKVFARHGVGGAQRELEAGRLRTTAIAERVVKAAVSAGSLGGLLGSPDGHVVGADFVASLRSTSIFARLLDGGAGRIPFNSAIGVLTTRIAASEVGEGKATPVSAIALSTPKLTPVKVAAMCIVTDELLAFAPGTGDLVQRELAGALGTAIDAAFLTGIAGSIGTAASAGSIEADVLAALTGMRKTGAERLYWLAAVDVGNRIGSMSATLLPAALVELPVVVSDGAPAGTLTLIDASALVGNLEMSDLRVSREAAVELNTIPTNASAPPVATQLVSMFQTDSAAILATASLGVEAIRNPAAFTITAIAWT